MVNSEQEKEQVVRIEDAVNIACHLLYSMQYGNSIDDLVVWASDYMKEASVQAIVVEEE